MTATTLADLKLSATAVSDPVITMMEDDAYLMSMVDTDSLLPTSMTFGGMFEGESGLNAEELTGT